MNVSVKCNKNKYVSELMALYTHTTTCNIVSVMLNIFHCVLEIKSLLRENVLFDILNINFTKQIYYNLLPLCLNIED